MNYIMQASYLTYSRYNSLNQWIDHNALGIKKSLKVTKVCTGSLLSQIGGCPLLGIFAEIHDFAVMTSTSYTLKLVFEGKLIHRKY